MMIRYFSDAVLFIYKEHTQSPVSMNTVGIKRQETISLFTIPSLFPGNTLPESYPSFLSGSCYKCFFGSLWGFLAAFGLLLWCFCCFSSSHPPTQSYNQINSPPLQLSDPRGTSWTALPSNYPGLHEPSRPWAVVFQFQLTLSRKCYISGSMFPHVA